MRNVVVTGGGTGIGRAVAAAFAELGDAVIITGRRADVLAKTAADLGAGVRPAAFDATDPEQVEAALPGLPESVHVLVHCAGGNTSIAAPEPGTLAETAAMWRANLDANLISAVLVTAVLRPRLAPGGAVINISSIAAHRGGAGSYGAAKAAVEAWNLTLAQDLGQDQITANVIAPGFIDTDMTAGLTEARRAEVLAGVPLKRYGSADEVAAAAVFLASDAAAYITGAVLPVDGGVAMGL
jgi:3-oxoacyl-[acyl-carrier protein] reductase